MLPRGAVSIQVAKGAFGPPRVGQEAPDQGAFEGGPSLRSVTNPEDGEKGSSDLYPVCDPKYPSSKCYYVFYEEAPNT